MTLAIARWFPRVSGGVIGKRSLPNGLLQTRWSLARSACEGKVRQSNKCFSLNFTYVVAFCRLDQRFGPTFGVRNSHFSGGRNFKNALRAFESVNSRDWNCVSAIFRWSLLSGGRKDRFDCIDVIRGSASFCMTSIDVIRGHASRVNVILPCSSKPHYLVIKCRLLLAFQEEANNSDKCKPNLSVSPPSRTRWRLPEFSDRWKRGGTEETSPAMSMCPWSTAGTRSWRWTEKWTHHPYRLSPRSRSICCKTKMKEKEERVSFPSAPALLFFFFFKDNVSTRFVLVFEEIMIWPLSTRENAHETAHNTST